MSEITVAPFALDDVHEMIAYGFVALTSEELATLFVPRSEDEAYTLRADGVPVTAFGLTIYWPGVGEVWLVPTPLMVRHAKSVVVHVRRLLASAIATRKLHRIQADVRADFAVGQRFAEAFGLSAEGLVSQLDTERRDYIRYAWTAPREETS